MLLKNIIVLAALGLASLVAADESSEDSIGRPCGFKIALCPEDQKCVPNSPKCKNINKCPGTCQWKNQYKSCGGFRVKPVNCPEGYECKDDPRLPSSCGMACDRPGICLPTGLRNCGGFAGLECPYGLYCYDQPNDGCDPKKGGADCFGVCI
ncbi:Kazal domain-containing protein [Thelonectria olida]|uniref:Kazal domain-containing protein n=1 Tax=Thelonectria olida TaxID=1576542 RepID=A0A9P8W4K5_9HYPO|nr:Kazal domain-containing protein [Thelonectria olida]